MTPIYYETSSRSPSLRLGQVDFPQPMSYTPYVRSFGYGRASGGSALYFHTDLVKKQNFHNVARGMGYENCF